MTATFDRINEKLAAFNQQHLIQFWDELNQAQQNSLANQIDELDLVELDALIANMKNGQVWSDLAARAQPPNAIRLHQQGPVSREQAIEAGESALRSNKIGMVLVAGGQGTRLGFDEPKGMYPLGPLSKRSLFQILIEKVLALGNFFGSDIPLFVMTSPATHEKSVQFLEQHHRFGIKPDNFQVFCQGTMPAVDVATGKIILASKDVLFSAPNGHGGSITALDQNGCLDAMADRGIEHVFYCQIDNPMVQVCDPLTIGYHLLMNSELTTQACPKRDALQKVGNIVEVDGRVRIIEYSDLPDEIAQQKNSDGGLKLWAGNIAVHIFDVGFLQRMVCQADALPFHLAKKKVAFIDESGSLVEPLAANAIKFERFIFDLLPMAKNALVVEVDPREAFSPVKNAADAVSETAETAQAAMMNQARDWLRRANVAIDDSIPYEISPLFALSAEQLAKKVSGQTNVTAPAYLH